MLTRTLLITGAILVSALCITVTLNTQLTKFNQTFQYKDFENDGPDPAPQMIRLNDKQFVVVDTENQMIAVYSVDAQGKLTRTSEYETRTSPLKPLTRPVE